MLVGVWGSSALLSHIPIHMGWYAIDVKFHQLLPLGTLLNDNLTTEVTFLVLFICCEAYIIKMNRPYNLSNDNQWDNNPLA